MQPLTIGDAVRARGQASSPLVTHYDLSSGSRIELSGVSFANWVAKTSAMALDLVDRGDAVFIDLPVHWMEPVWAGAAWNSGLVVVDSAADADLVVCGPDALDTHSGGTTPVVATSLHPLGLRFDRELPVGVTDFGAEVFGQPDSFVPFDPPGPDDPSVRRGGFVMSQRGLLEAAASSPCAAPGSRTITDARAVDLPYLLLGPLLGGGGTVWVSSSDDEGWTATAQSEGATVEVRA